MSRYRLDSGGTIDRAKPLAFRFNGRDYQGYAGDTLASALFANGVRLVGRSASYHRPRGVMSTGSENADALVQLQLEEYGGGPVVEASRLALYDGLQALSINCWPGVGFDLGTINDVLSALLPARHYEKISLTPLRDFYMRRIGSVAVAAATLKTYQQNRSYPKRNHPCDVLVVGAGPAGLAAALTAGRTGARVLLVDEQPRPGGDLLNHPNADEIGGRPALDWVADIIDELDALPKVVRLSDSIVTDYQQQNRLSVVEHKPAQPWSVEYVWQVQAKRVILATGSAERPLVFADNDRPGVMLAASARAYFNRYAVRCGYDVVVFTNNNSAYTTAFDIARSHTTVAAIVDTRIDIDPCLQDEAERLNVKLFSGHGIIAVGGRNAVNMVEIAPLNDVDNNRRIVCDLICHSGGWDPRLQLQSQSGVRPVYDAGSACFVPGQPVQAEYTIGAARGLFALQDCLRDGFEAGAKAAQVAGYEVAIMDVPPASRNLPLAIEAIWELPGRPHSGKAFVDFQNDVTTADLRLMPHGDFPAINTNMIGVLAQQLGVEPDEVGRSLS